MRVSLLIPHWKTPHMTAYCISQYLKFKGDHDLRIFISNNSPGHDSIDYLAPFKNEITIIDHPADIMHSHGTSLDRLVPLIDTEYFITAETDSFPAENGYLDFYEHIIKMGYEIAGSKLVLSGGEYIHPCGALYSKSLWEEAKAYCDKIEYNYYPNMALRDGFANHLMVHKSIMSNFSANPEEYIELASEYRNRTLETMEERRLWYLPTVGPFHNGMGCRQESVKTYGFRTIESETPYTLLTPKCMKWIGRIGLEPGQWLTYFASAVGKKMCFIPTETKWVEGMENQQQEYTRNESGIVHLWGITAHMSMNYVGEQPEWIKEKLGLPEKLYNTLLYNQKIH